MIRIIHHDDNDGRASAAIVYWTLLDGGKDKAYIRLHEVNYSSFNKDVIHPGDVVYMVDFSARPEVMEWIDKTCYGEFHWIDHHKSAIEDMLNAGLSPMGIRTVGFAGCILTWVYMSNKVKHQVHDELHLDLSELPKNIDYLGTYDVWDKESKDWEEVLAHQTGFSTMEWTEDPTSPMWNQILNDEVVSKQIFDYSVNIGHTMNRARSRWDASSMKQSYSRTIVVENKEYEAIVYNGGRGSNQFKSVWDKEKFDVMVAWRYDGESYTYSFYSYKDDVDCSEIAKYFGGGGHKGAAGCVSKTQLL